MVILVLNDKGRQVQQENRHEEEATGKQREYPRRVTQENHSKETCENKCAAQTRKKTQSPPSIQENIPLSLLSLVLPLVFPAVFSVSHFLFIILQVCSSGTLVTRGVVASKKNIARPGLHPSFCCCLVICLLT